MQTTYPRKVAVVVVLLLLLLLVLVETPLYANNPSILNATTQGICQPVPPVWCRCGGPTRICTGWAAEEEVPQRHV